MGGTNSGRSHEPQQCGEAHLTNTLSWARCKTPPQKKTRQGTPKGYPNLVFSLKIEVCKKLIKSKTSIKYLSDTVNWFLR